MGGGQHAPDWNLDAEVGEFVRVLLWEPAGVVGGQDEADAILAQEGEEILQAGHRLVAAPQHSIHIHNQVSDSTQRSFRFQV